MGLLDLLHKVLAIRVLRRGRIQTVLATRLLIQVDVYGGGEAVWGVATAAMPAVVELTCRGGICFGHVWRIFDWAYPALETICMSILFTSEDKVLLCLLVQIFDLQEAFQTAMIFGLARQFSALKFLFSQ